MSGFIHWRATGAPLASDSARLSRFYNKSVNVLESRVLTSTRRFQELRVASDHQDIDEMLPIDRNVREINADELASNDGEPSNV